MRTSSYTVHPNYYLLLLKARNFHQDYQGGHYASSLYRQLVSVLTTNSVQGNCNHKVQSNLCASSNSAQSCYSHHKKKMLEIQCPQQNPTNRRNVVLESEQTARFSVQAIPAFPPLALSAKDNEKYPEARAPTHTGHLLISIPHHSYKINARRPHPLLIRKKSSLVRPISMALAPPSPPGIARVR
jgi:hypothetical protein